MKYRFYTMIALCTISVSLAATRIPLSGIEDIRLKYDSQVSDGLQVSISNDLVKCLAPYTNILELFSSSDNPSNTRFWLDYFTPYGEFAAIEGLGPRFPEYGIYSNGLFTLDVSYTFATNYQRHIESTAAYSNEIAAAYAFIESLSPTNLAVMSTNELQSLDLWKEVPPGQFPPDIDIGKSIAYCRNRRVFAPPRVAFHVWECGPNNNPPYLWCTVPSMDTLGHASANMMIYFQNQWRFSSWPFQRGEQQW